MYNQTPNDWLEQIKAIYPKRSGPMRWPRVFLPVRRALMETTWDDLIKGVHRYAAYIQASGKAGSDFVTTPENFFKDEIYLEDLVYAIPKDPKLVEYEAHASAQRARVEAEAQAERVSYTPLDSTAAIATRISLAKTRGPDRPVRDIRSDIAGLADRLRMQK